MALRRRAALAVVIGVVVGLSACGGDDGASSTGLTSTTTTVGSTTTTLAVSSSTTTVVAPTTAASAATTAKPTNAKATTTARATTTTRGSTTVKPTTTAKPTTTPGDIAAVRLKVTRVASASAPIALATRPAGAMYLAQKTGQVRLFKNGVLDPSPVLDIRGQISNGGEQGLLDITFSPKGNFLYVFYTDAGGDERLDEYAFGAGDRAIDPASRRNVLTIADPASNHNGGRIVFGPDGYLWWSLGDGGGANNQFGNAQNDNQLLGKILRIDPRPSPGAAYSSAPDNPHASGRGGGRPEIAVTGLRNPWRYSFDRATGNLWIGDVGQNRYEEVDLLRAGHILGANMGWSYREGAHPFDGKTPPPGVVDPVYDYGRNDGQAVCGGYVYRGAAVPALRGIYVYADTYTARLQLLSVGPGGTRHRDTGVGVPGGIVSSFAEGGGGELYVLSLQGGGVFRIEAA